MRYLIDSEFKFVPFHDHQNRRQTMRFRQAGRQERKRRLIGWRIPAVFVLGIALGAGSAAGSHHTSGTTGWTYGGNNCGCGSNPNPTRFSCERCCRQAARVNGPLPAADLQDCLDFCNQASFPCLPSPCGFLCQLRCILTFQSPCP